jgi:hypothetical protein
VSAPAVIVVLALAPGPDVPPDLVAEVHDAVGRELSDDAIDDAAGRLRNVDTRTGARARFFAARDRVKRLRADFPDDALDAAREAATAGESGFLTLTDRDEVVEALVALGALELDAGHPAAARKAFSVALDLSPGHRADPARIGPRARKLLAEVRPPTCARLDEARLLRAAEALGADRVLVLRGCPEGGRVRVIASEVRPGRGRTDRAVTVALGGRIATADARRLAGLPVERERPWYGRPWLWVAVGTAAVAAVAIPLATADETGTVRVQW